MSIKNLLISCTAVLAMAAGLAGCEQERVTYKGPEYLMFSDTLYYYGVQETNEIFNVPVAATVAADCDRTFAVEVIDSKSNAIEGRHYRILSNTVTIKAGERVGNVEVQGVYENIAVGDSLGFTLNLIIPEAEEWNLYTQEAKVVMQKVCPFDINDFSGWCVVKSTLFGTDFMPNTNLRLITSDVVEDEENTVVLHGLYMDGYDTKISFSRKELLQPELMMKQQVVCTTGEMFGTIYGDGNLLVSQPNNGMSFYSTCEKFALQYATLSVNEKDGSEFGVVGTFVNLIEWISDEEAEKLKEQGY